MHQHMQKQMEGQKVLRQSRERNRQSLPGEKHVLGQLKPLLDPSVSAGVIHRLDDHGMEL